MWTWRCSSFDRFTLREVALVSNLGFNLLSVSQLLDEGFEVRFKEVCSCNTRFTKERKPSNHIRARIKSHVYTIE